uniref:Circadian clock-controlled protein n=1 Tax=Homalodisca liturata TaxID=320908 RepID=A0A1B6HSA9_9HEMI
MSSCYCCFLLLAVCCLGLGVNAQQTVPAYVKQCKRSSPKLEECLIKALHHVRPYLVKGIPEIEMPSVEPFILDSLTLSLTGGERGYKITLRDIHMYGASNFTVSRLKLSHNGQPFEAKIHIPEMKIDANYTSSGVLIVLPASGGGLFHATLGNVAATIKGFVSSKSKGGQDYLNVDKLDINLVIKDINMNVKKVFNNNRILTEATNLFLKENGQEVLHVMMPQLKVKMAAVIKKVVNQLLSHTPVQLLVTL